MKEVSAAATADAFMQGWIQYYGLPYTITTDLGPQFASQIRKELMVFQQVFIHSATVSWRLFIVDY